MDINPADQHDDLRAAVDVVGDRWVLLLVAALADGPRRFGDLAREVRGVAPNVLTDRLRRAERAGLIVATAYQHRPRRVVYDLTAAGREVATILPAFSAWSARRRGATPPRHPTCGTPLELRWWCPECAIAIAPANVAGDGRPTDVSTDDLVWV
jgi:DNA-binding HxlR family transcriptional regulator